MEVKKDMMVFDILEKHPLLLEIFIKKGFVPLSVPVLRNKMTKAITIEQACINHGVDVEEFI